MQEHYATAFATEDTTQRNIALAKLQAEQDIRYQTKVVEEARSQIERAASDISGPGYADSIEGWLRNWRLAYINLEKAHYTLQLLNQLQDTSA
jgi:hypothetical protein